MKNITRTIRTLNIEYPVKTENGFATRTETVIDMGEAAIRKGIKERCAGDNVKFLGEYEVISADERSYSMPIDTFLRFATEIH